MVRYDRDVGCMGVPADMPPRRAGVKRFAVAVAVATALMALGAAQVAGMGDPTGAGCAGSPLGQQGEGC